MSNQALTALRARQAELSDLASLGRLAAWDQRTLMPPAGAARRGDILATLERISHQRSTADEIGEWIEALEGDGSALSELDRDIVRLARRGFDRMRRVPEDLAAELAHAAAEGQTVWETARAQDDFALFAPALRRNVELARAYAACFADEQAYDALLADYDWGLTGARVEEVFAALREELPGLVAEAAARRDPVALEVPVDAQRVAVDRVLRIVGVDDASWRVDTSAHPFTSWVGRDDIRLTTRYVDGRLESVLAALHEFGHGLYENQIPVELSRTALGQGASMSAHESQSKLWENHVGRNPAFAAVIARALGEGGFDVEPDHLHAAITDVRPSLIRVAADAVSYPLHIVLRFELERALIDGALEVADLPAAWNDAVRALLGIEVPDNASGVLQDVHWATGAFGYFPSYALGVLIAAQMWEALESAVGPQGDALRTGDVTAVRSWLADHVHRHGARLDTEPLVEAATGAPMSSDAFLRSARTVAGA